MDALSPRRSPPVRRRPSFPRRPAFDGAKGCFTDRLVRKGPKGRAQNRRASAGLVGAGRLRGRAAPCSGSNRAERRRPSRCTRKLPRDRLAETPAMAAGIGFVTEGTGPTGPRSCRFSIRRRKHGARVGCKRLSTGSCSSPPLRGAARKRVGGRGLQLRYRAHRRPGWKALGGGNQQRLVLFPQSGSPASPRCDRRRGRRAASTWARRPRCNRLLFGTSRNKGCRDLMIFGASCPEVLGHGRFARDS